MRPPISFIVPAFNCEETLEESIRSIFDGNLNAEDEVIVVNDASTDGTPQLIRKLIEEHQQLLVVHHRVNKGSAAASRNTGIDAAKNELIFCLDSDNILESGSIDSLYECLEKENAGAAAFGEIRFFEEEKDKVNLVWKMMPNISFIDNINKANQTPCSSGNYLFTRESWKKANRYNEHVGGAYDSWAFGCAQLGSGTKMVTLPGSYYFHRFGYESTYMREVGKRNVSLTILQVLIPFLHLLHPKDVRRIFHPRHRMNWFDKVGKRPLRGIVS